MENSIIITKNEPFNRLEIEFKNEPSNDLIKYLIALGFKRKQKTSTAFYTAYHPSYIQFANDLKDSLAIGGNYTEISIYSSYLAIQENIDSSLYSYVIISYKDGEGEQRDHFIVFDHYKRIARAIATQYGIQTYGENFIEALVFPKEKKEAAKQLLKEDKILGNTTDQVAIDQTIEKDTDQKISEPTQITTDDRLIEKQNLDTSPIAPQDQEVFNTSTIHDIGFKSDMPFMYGLVEQFTPEALKEDYPLNHSDTMEKQAKEPIEVKQKNTSIPSHEEYENEVEQINKKLEECQNDLKGCKKKPTNPKKKRTLTRYAKIQNHLIAIGNLIPPRLKENIEIQKQTKRMLKEMHRKIVTHYRMISLKQICSTQEQIEEKYKAIVTRLENRK